MPPSDGRQWIVPAPVNEGPIAVDVFNNCTGTGDIPDYASQLKTVVIDEDGVEITGFIHADNYFELYVNGRFVARDSPPMTPFNTSVVRFEGEVSDDVRHHGRSTGRRTCGVGLSMQPSTSATRA
mgnify:CR=1 FL=1